MIIEIINKKKQGIALSEKEIAFFVKGVVAKTIPSYQISALCMAILLRGMDHQETTFLTKYYVQSGQTIEWGDWEKEIIDKHSTGGVGDKTSLILIPLLGAFGLRIAKLSGQGLGFTGGTIDKLAAIPGFNSLYSREKFIERNHQFKMTIAQANQDFAPADKIIYGIRDVTGTVDSDSLIAASIMAKKIATGAPHILIDLKIGNGSTVGPSIEKGESLAQTMLAISKNFGKKTTVVLSGMFQPLGQTIGNALEIKEAIEILQGQGPEDVRELITTLGACQLVQVNKATTLEEGKAMISNKLKTKKPLLSFFQWIASQGGDIECLNNLEQFTAAPFSCEITAAESGFIAAFETNRIGHLAVQLGAGRKTIEDQIDFQAGIILCHKLGDLVKKGEKVMILQSSGKINNQLIAQAQNSFTISLTQPSIQPLVLKILN